jgi:hypothetical protein
VLAASRRLVTNPHSAILPSGLVRLIRINRFCVCALGAKHGGFANRIADFTVHGIKDSPPYLHDGRCLTLEDTVEFFNLVLSLKLSKEEKADLVTFMRQL